MKCLHACTVHTVHLLMQLYSPTVICPLLPELANGMISYFGLPIGRNRDEYAIGTVATYRCNQGYELVTHLGSRMSTCRDVGDGSSARFDGQAPTCERKK